MISNLSSIYLTKNYFDITLEKLQGIFEHFSRNLFSNAQGNQQFDSKAFEGLQGVAQTLCENKQCYEEKLNVRHSTKTRNLVVLTSISYKKRTD